MEGRQQLSPRERPLAHQRPQLQQQLQRQTPAQEAQQLATTQRPDLRRQPLQPLEPVFDEQDGQGCGEQGTLNAGSNSDQENIHPSPKTSQGSRTRATTASTITTTATTTTTITASSPSSPITTITTTVSPTMDTRRQPLQRERGVAQRRPHPQPQLRQPVQPAQSPTQSPRHREPLSPRTLQIRKQQLRSRFNEQALQQLEQQAKHRQELNLLRQQKEQLLLQEQELLYQRERTLQQAEKEKQKLLKEEMLLEQEEQRLQREKRRVLERELQELQEAQLRRQTARVPQASLQAPTRKRSRSVEEEDLSDEKVSRARIEQDQKRAQEATDQHVQTKVEQSSPLPPLQLQTTPSPSKASASPTRKRARDTGDEPSDEKVSRARIQAPDPNDAPVASTATTGSNQQYQQVERQNDTTRQLKAEIEQPSQQPEEKNQDEDEVKVEDKCNKFPVDELCKLYASHYHYNEYEDTKYKYCLVTLPKKLLPELPPEYRQYPEEPRILTLRLLSEQEWRFLAIDLEEGWEHYDRHDPEPRTLMFRKRKPYE